MKIKQSYLLKSKIELRNINFNYHDSKKILNNLNLSIKFGEIIGIKGSSGVGKTTLVNLILGLLKPSEGEIFIDDINLIGFEKNGKKLQVMLPKEPI